MFYLKKFNTHSEYEAFRTSNEFLLPNVSYTLENRKKIYNKIAKKQYLTFVAIEDGTFKFSGNSIDYSIDSGNTWTTLASDTNSPTVESGHTIMWKASGLTPTSTGIGKFSSTGKFNVEGNIMSLYYGDNFKEQTSLSGKDRAFFKLFDGCTGIISAENLSLPATTFADRSYCGLFQHCTSLTIAPKLSATTLASNCYKQMFWDCTSLTTAPSLPATTLAYGCYENMFYFCVNLTNILELPATTLAERCYKEMFAGCTSLTTAPKLSATTLAEKSYEQMFSGCTSLNSITCLATDISATDCTNVWVNGVAASGTFTKAASMNDWTTGDSGIPTNWTVQDAS